MLTDSWWIHPFPSWPYEWGMNFHYFSSYNDCYWMLLDVFTAGQQGFDSQLILGQTLGILMPWSFELFDVEHLWTSVNSSNWLLETINFATVRGWRSGWMPSLLQSSLPLPQEFGSAASWFPSSSGRFFHPFLLVKPPPCQAKVVQRCSSIPTGVTWMSCRFGEMETQHFPGEFKTTNSSSTN